MAEQECNSSKASSTEEVAASVANRMEAIVLSCCAMDNLCVQDIALGKSDESMLVIMRDFLRSTARDAENCAPAVALSGGVSKIGYFADHFGEI
ncbi:hypothetical protein M0D69_11160 [Caballeronia sp. SEWSISQ10-4 2]|uniref:hypothetical protein n=1 Tax=Caballeronia sp. SEWSISQ10-4 2 TaxID=2937438 RepID=UPI00264D4185|nr:hypothetical protein [Caballeronia sp. SEWSISQ10-4 2]MDN7178570.1 hypothetical protein [Caballeronia sp. SEWSISQ10-4 2]